MLNRKYKLKKDKDFKQVFQDGHYFFVDFISLKLIENDLKSTRFAFLIGLKVSKKAVVRNKIKRQLEEIVRNDFDKLKIGFDIVIMVKPDIADKDYDQIKETIMKLFEKANLLN